VELDYNICFDELFWEQNKRFRVEQNDVLMAMSGATTGKAGIYREIMPALINQRVACIRAKDGVACPIFLFVATQLEWMYDLIQETSAGCAQPNISGKQIENMPMPDASYEQQQQFASFVEQTDKSKMAIQQSLDKLELLKKSLMQEYFG
jgi:type I restriction enzyme S subunit